VHAKFKSCAVLHSTALKLLRAEEARRMHCMLHALLCSIAITQQQMPSELINICCSENWGSYWCRSQVLRSESCSTHIQWICIA